MRQLRPIVDDQPPKTPFAEGISEDFAEFQLLISSFPILHPLSQSGHRVGECSMLFVSISRNVRAFARFLLQLGPFGVFACLAMISAANALNINKIEGGLSLAGEITEGSPQEFSIRLAEILLEMQARGDRNNPVDLRLNIPGGGLASASFEIVGLMKIAQSHGTSFAAHIDGDATCTSGCTYLFLAADERWIAPEGRLIFHGFSQGHAKHPTRIPVGYVKAYQELLKSANEPFYDFMMAARVIEDNRFVGFTGSTLFGQKAFSGLITGLKAN